MCSFRLAATVFAITSVIACSPTSPTECVNGRDGFGRGPEVQVLLDCVTAGSDIHCTALHQEGGYCAGPSRDVTTTATWTSSDAAVAEVTTPGVLHTIGSG